MYRERERDQTWYHRFRKPFARNLHNLRYIISSKLIVLLTNHFYKRTSKPNEVFRHVIRLLDSA